MKAIVAAASQASILGLQVLIVVGLTIGEQTVIVGSQEIGADI